ncbi:MAG: nuclear transport factor 2 family protein [Burkholderiales bacterium]
MSVEREILALEDRRCAAMTGRDADALAAMLHDELVYTHSSAVVDDKASYVEAIRSGRTRYHSIKRSEERVRAYGDTAFVSGRAEIEVDVNGQHKSLRLRFLDAWTRTREGWKFVAWQSTAIPQK